MEMKPSEPLSSNQFKVTCANNPGGRKRFFSELTQFIQEQVKGSLNRGVKKPCHAYSYTTSPELPCYACDKKDPHWTDIILE
jgi:hypothetical protein